MADLELERATVEALETLGLAQLDSLETCNTIIGGDIMDLLDTTELPPAKSWKGFNDALEEWKKVNEGGEFWSLVSQSWGGDTGTGHRALLALLHLAFCSKEKGEEPWLAAKTYVWLMDLPGASAYGVFNGAMFRSLLALIKSWLEAAASGGVDASAGGSSAAAAASSSAAAAEQQSSQSTAAASSQGTSGRSRRAAATRRPVVDNDEDDDDDDDEDDSGDEGGRRGRSKRTTRGAKRGGGNSLAATINKGLELLLRAMEQSLASGSLGASLRAHDDVQGELTDLVLGVYALAPASGSLADATRGVLMALVGVAGGEGGNPIVLRALMPLLTMKPSRNGLPTDARTRTGAHQKAVQVLLTLVKEGEEQKKRRAVEKEGEEEEGEEHQEGGGEEKEKGEGEEGEGMEVDVDDDAVKEKEQGEGEEEEEEEEEGGKGKGKKKGKKGKGGKKGKKSTRTQQADDDMELEEGGERASSPTAGMGGGGGEEEDKEAAAKRKKKEKNTPTDLHMTVLAVLEHMCTEAPDRADVRSRLVDSVLSLLESLQKVAPELGPRFILFLAKLLRSAKVSHRAFGVEIAASFVNAPWAWPSEEVIALAEAAEGKEETQEEEATKEAKAVWKSLVALVESFASRVLDKAPTVRARAMVCLSEMLISIQEEAAPPGLREAILALAFSSHTEVQQQQQQQQEVAPPQPQDLVSLVRTRCQDDKAVVRKAALQALEILLTTGAKRGGRNVTRSDVALFATRCNDVSVLTRKQAMASLSSLLLTDPGNHSLQATWVKAVLPLVADPEQSILNRLVDLVHEVILDRIIAWHRQRKETAAAASRPAPAAAARPRRAAAVAEQEEEEEDEEGKARREAELHARTATVWELLSIVASRDLNKCLQNAIGLVLVQSQTSTQTSSGSSSSTPRRLKELMEALQSAALASIDSAGAATGGEDPTSLRRGAWALLEAILASDKTANSFPGATSGMSKVLPSDPAFVITCWRRAFEGLGGEAAEAEAMEDDARKILRVLARIAPDVPSEMGMGLAEELLGCLAKLDPRLSPENCGAALETISALCLAKAPSQEEGAVIIRKAAMQVLEACEKVLRSFVGGGGAGAGEEGQQQRQVMAQLQRATFLVGSVAILGFTPNEEEIKKQSGAAAEEASAGKEKGGKGKKKKDDVAKPVAGTPGGGPLIRVPVPAATISLIRVLLLPEIIPLEAAAEKQKASEETAAAAAAAAAEGGEGDDATAAAAAEKDTNSSSSAVPVPEEVRAHAFLALGKICLRDKALAKENVNVFVRELSLSSSAAIKSNALLILGDLCVRYTSLVERHVPAMARCLQDESALIRRHALALISQLLLQDYLKWRGLLLHRYLAILVDKDARVSEVAEYMIFTPLLRKCPSLFVNHFVESLVVLNGCVDHDSYKAALSQGAESGTAVTMEGVDLEGEGVAAKKRMHIYKAMLQHMSDEQRIQVTAKLTQDILGAATDEDGESGGIKIQSHHRASRFAQGQRREAILRKLKRDENLVRDALAVLRCPDIKVAGGRVSEGGAAQDEDAEALMVGGDDGAGGADAAAAAKGRLLSKVSRKHLLEHVVPELVSLKACLERAHSPLIRDVMEYFLELMKSHKEEVKDALSSNPTLFHEIEFDLIQFEKEMKAQAEARAAMPPPAPVPRSPGDALIRQSMDGGRRSSAAPPGTGGRTPMTSLHTGGGKNANNTSGKKTPRLSGCSAPRLRRSSTGASLSRTPSEAIKAAMHPSSGGTASQSFTPATTMSGKKVVGGGSASASYSAGGEVAPGEEAQVNVRLPKAMKAWNVTVEQSPLDRRENQENSMVMADTEN